MASHTRIGGRMIGSKSVAFMATCLLVLLISVDASTINIKNNCSQTITACSASQSASTACYVLGAGSGSDQLIDVGSSWPGGIVWGFPGSGSPVDGNNAKPQANLAEFTINGFDRQDYYDMSLVNAYNLPMQIDAIGRTGSGTSCGTIQCSIPNLNKFCQLPNTLTGPPGDGCYNHDGNSSLPTPATQNFKNACPEAITFPTDTTGIVYGCSTGTNYEVVFCYSGALNT